MQHSANTPNTDHKVVSAIWLSWKIQHSHLLSYLSKMKWMALSLSMLYPLCKGTRVPIHHQSLRMPFTLWQPDTLWQPGSQRMDRSGITSTWTTHQSLLKHMQDKMQPPNSCSHPLNYADLWQGIKKWKESTTTSPYIQIAPMSHPHQQRATKVPSGTPLGLSNTRPRHSSPGLWHYDPHLEAYVLFEMLVYCMDHVHWAGAWQSWPCKTLLHNASQSWLAAAAQVAFFLWLPAKMQTQTYAYRCTRRW